MSKYDRQMVALFLAGGEVDPSLREAARDLAAKAERKELPCRLVEAPPAAAPEPAGFGWLTPQSRLYIVGRGDWQGQQVSGWTPRQMADFLAGGGMPSIRRISIVADAAGRDRGSGDEHPTTEPADSFASAFHRHLHDAYAIDTEVVARVHAVAVLGAAEGEDRGRKLTWDPEAADWRHHGASSKLGFFWANGAQQRRWEG